MRVKKLPDLAAAMDMPAVALTDTNAMFAALEFSVTAAKAGVQPIVGCQVDVEWDKDQRGGVVLLAQSEAGYANLMKLNSCLYLGKGGALPSVTPDELTAHAEGLICLTGGAMGPLGQALVAGQVPRAEALLDAMTAAFPDRLYIEIQRHPGSGPVPEAERATEASFLTMAHARDLPLVATNDVYFPKPAMYEAHDALICIAEGAYVDQAGPRRRLTEHHCFKSQEEMVTLFADLPEALEATVEIARRCAFRARTRDPILPRFADDEVEELRRQAKAGLAARLAVIPHAAPVAEYEARLDFELGIIEGMGFPGYFLIVADFIKWAKDHDIPVGPGRGSGAGSLVAYALTITDLDPLRYQLLFERFLNPERVSMPDFDIDFCMDRREEVIRYVQDRYGRDKVGQIITFGALLSKAAVRDVGRVLQMPYGQVDRLSKMIPVEGVKPVSIEKALADEPRLREEADREEVVKRLLDYGQQIEGLLRNASTHAAGVVIGARPLDELVPLYQDPRSDMPATQFNMKWVEQAGLVKFDFLGLKTLTVIQNAVDAILSQGRSLHIAPDGRTLYTPARGAENEINAIPLDDEETYKLYAAAKTVAVFQVESTGMMDALRRMRPTCIEDIVALVALYRPGPMENIPTYCEVKNGQREIASIHPSIDHILEETQGIIVYQEQVMQIAQVMAGYSLGGADLLRRARESGFKTLVLTVDVPAASRRERQRRAGIPQPPATPGISPRLMLPAALRPRLALGTLRYGRPNLRSIEPSVPAMPTAPRTLEAPTLVAGQRSWDDLEHVRKIWPGNMILKGVMQPKDAQRARDAGVNAVWVSNHSGRQFDAAPSSLSALQAIRAALGSDEHPPSVGMGDDVGALGPRRSAEGTLPDRMALADRRERVAVELHDPHVALAIPLGLGSRRRTGEPHPIAVEGQRGVDARQSVEPDGLGPRTRGIRRRHEEVPAALGRLSRARQVRAHHVDPAVVVSDRRSEQPARRVDSREVELIGDDVADELPVDEVA